MLRDCSPGPGHQARGSRNRGHFAPPIPAIPAPPNSLERGEEGFRRCVGHVLHHGTGLVGYLVVVGGCHGETIAQANAAEDSAVGCSSATNRGAGSSNDTISLPRSLDFERNAVHTTPRWYLLGTCLSDDVPTAALGPRRQGQVFYSARVPRRLEEDRQNAAKRLVDNRDGEKSRSVRWRARHEQRTTAQQYRM